MALSLSEGLSQANEHLKAGRKSEALTVLNTLVRDYPQEARVWGMLAMTSDDPQQKREGLEQVLALGSDPNMLSWAQKQLNALPVQSAPAPVMPSQVPPQPAADIREELAPSATKRGSGVSMINVLAGVAILLLVAVVGLVGFRLITAQRQTSVPPVVADQPTAEVATRAATEAAADHTDTPPPTATATATTEPTLTSTPNITATPSEADLIVQQGDELRKAWRWQEAVEQYNLALQLDPNSVNAYIGRARAQLNLNLFVEAQADIDMIVQLDPKHPEGLLLQGRLYEAQGILRTPLNLYDEAIELDPLYSRSYSVRGEYYNNVLGNAGRAESDFKRALMLDETNFAAYNGLGNLAMDQNDYEEALSYFQKAGEFYPNEPVTTSNAGIALVWLERYDEAVAAFQAVIAYVPSYPYAHSGLGWAYYEMQRYQEAVVNITEAIALGDHDRESVHTRALAYMHLHDFGSALIDWNDLMEERADVCMYNNRCVTHNGLGNFEEAVFDCTISIDSGGPFSAYFNRAVAYDRLGENQLAIEDYMVILTYFPSDSPEALYAEQRVNALTGNAAASLPDVTYSTAPRFAKELNQAPTFPLSLCDGH